MEPLTWGPLYELGNPHLDAQHRNLLNLVNEAMAAVELQEESLLEPILDRLVEYVKVHFADEESLMAKVGFPGLEAHLHEHQGFHERVTDLYSRYLAGDPHMVPELAGFLRAWLVTHIQGSDRQYIPYLVQLQASEP